MENIPDILNLPVSILSLIAAGYLSYRLAYTGRDGSHRTIDVVFLVCVFAFVAKTAGEPVGSALREADCGPVFSSVVSGLIGLLAALVVATVWRKWGENCTRSFLRKARVSSSDRFTSAWETLIANNKLRPSMLVLRKVDGSAVMCDQLSDFSDAPLGVVLLGNDGSVALYITHRRSKVGAEWIEEEDVKIDGWGPEITFVPASEIAEISLRSP